MTSPRTQVLGISVILAFAVAIGVAVWLGAPRGDASGAALQDSPAETPTRFTRSGQEARTGASGASPRPVAPVVEPAATADDSGGAVAHASAARPNIAEYNLLDTEDLAKLLEAYGSFEELYRAADGEQRLALAMYLAHEDAMRDYIGPLLALETDSDMRAFLLMRTLPEGYFDEPDPENPFPRDDDLMRILDGPMETPIELDEWMARMELALDLDYDYALRWIRDGQRLFPDNPEMQLLASTMLVNLGASLGTLSDTEVRTAEQSLYNSLSGPGAEQFTPGQRMRGYWALVFAQDRTRTREFFNQRRTQETSPQVRDLLDNLLRQLDLLDLMQPPS